MRPEPEFGPDSKSPMRDAHNMKPSQRQQKSITKQTESTKLANDDRKRRPRPEMCTEAGLAEKNLEGIACRAMLAEQCFSSKNLTATKTTMPDRRHPAELEARAHCIRFG